MNFSAINETQGFVDNVNVAWHQSLLKLNLYHFFHSKIVHTFKS